MLRIKVRLNFPIALKYFLAFIALTTKRKPRITRSSRNRFKSRGRGWERKLKISRGVPEPNNYPFLNLFSNSFTHMIKSNLHRTKSIFKVREDKGFVLNSFILFLARISRLLTQFSKFFRN